MKPVNQRIINLFRVLKTTYRDRPYPQPDDRWQRDVMRRIEHLASSAVDGSLFQMIELVTWRLSPVTLSMILLCGIAWMNLETIPDWQIFPLITGGMEEMNLAEFFI
ncbi:MAG: hypothetical protein V2B19_08315 [Pseudomonadota bacterium]